MTQRDRHERASKIFAEALELPPVEREDYLRERCNGDEALFAGLMQLLGLDAESQGPVGRTLDPENESPAGAHTISLFGGRQRTPLKPAPGLGAGKVVGDFRLVSLIGQGGRGQVWEAEQLSLQRRVAVKFVRPERVTEKQPSYFERETRAGGRLNHAGIVAVHGFGEDDGIAWIAMELVEGCWTLRDFLDEAGKADEIPPDYDRQVAEFIARLAQALQAAHDAGVIHRDLKPQNVLVAPDESPRVTDFGLARITDESALSQTGDFAGTYFYMSPEQVAAKRMGIDHRTDIFSLGVVMYEMLTLRRPFQGDTTHQVTQQIVLNDPADMRTFRSKIPRDLAVICGKALEKDPDKRYASMLELAEDIERHLTNQPIHAKPPTRVERLVKWTRRHPTKSVTTGLVVVAFVLVPALGLRIARQKADLKTTSAALRQKTEELARTSAALEQRTEEAETSARIASERAEEARASAIVASEKADEAQRRTADVLRLSATQSYDDLHDAGSWSVTELTTDEIRRRLSVQLFKVTEAPVESRSFLVFGRRAHALCGGFGGHGLQSVCVTDLDGDQIPELTYSYSMGSGLHRSRIGICQIDNDQLLNEEATLDFYGDLFVRKETDSRVIVEIGQIGPDIFSWTPEAQLGVLELERSGSRLLPRITLAPLSEVHAKAVRIR